MNRAKHRITALALSLAILLGGIIWQSPIALQVQAAGAEIVINVSNVAMRVDVYGAYYQIDVGTQQSYSPEDTIIFTGTGNCALYLYDGVTVTLRNLMLEAPSMHAAICILTELSDTTLMLEGANTVKGSANRSGIRAGTNTHLVITGDGTLSAHGSYGAAGIGGNIESNTSGCGKVTIESGNVRSYGGGDAAGIGGGDGTGGDTGGQVIVNGGSLYAQSDNGYAIGARAGGTDAGSLIVNGGEVTLGNGGFGPASTGTFGWTGGTVGMEGTDPPRIDNTTASAFSFQNGDSVTVKGAGLGEVSAARVDGVEVTGLAVADDNTLTFTTPPGMTGGETLTVFSPTRGTGSGVLDYSIPAPVIATQGGGTEIPQGGALTLEVTNAVQYNAPVYQWYQNGSQLAGETGDTLVAAEAGAYKVAVTDEGSTRESGEISLTQQSDPPPPPPGNTPSVSTNSLTVMEGESGRFTVSLGSGTDGADSATVTSSDDSIAAATPTQLNQSGEVEVTGVSVGSATISIGYSGGSRDGDYDRANVTVTDQPVTQVQVDFDPQGGAPQPSPITVTVGGQYPALPTVSIEGYTFDGWYTTSGSHIREGDTVTIGTDHTLHARWSGEGGTTPPPPPVEPPIEPPPTTSSGGSSRSSSGGSSTPDGQAAKTQLPASAFSWDGERTLTIDHERITPLGLLSVRWNDITLTRGEDFGVYSGSVILRFSEEFIAAQAPGNHTVRVEFLNHYGETTVTVGGAAAIPDTDDNETYNPNTGGYPDGGMAATDNPNTGDGRTIWTALLLGGLGAALVFFPLQEQQTKMNGEGLK